MKRVLYMGLAVVVVALVAALISRSEREAGLVPLTAQFVRPGVLEVAGLAVEAAALVTVRDEAGRVVAQSRPYGRTPTHVRFAFRPGERYIVSAGPGRDVVVVAPRRPIEFAVRLHAPLGQMPHEYVFRRPYGGPAAERIALAAGPGETVDVMLEVEKLSNSPPIAFRLSSNAGALAAGGARLDPPPREGEQQLDFEFDRRTWIGHITLGEELPADPLLLALRGDGFALDVEVHFVGRGSGDLSVSLQDWSMPTDAFGLRQSHRMADQVTMPSPVWRRFSRWFGLRPVVVNYFEPFAFQTATIRNDGPDPVAIFLTCEVLDAIGRSPVRHFASPQTVATGDKGQVRGFARIAAGQVVPCVLPIHLSAETPAGSYLRRLTVTPMGSDRVLLSVEAPLGVVRSRPVFGLWVLGVAALSLGWLVVVALFFRRLAARLGVRMMVLLSLLGSLQFCFAFVGRLLSSVLYAFLGPFNCLVGGLFTEVMTYLLLTSILYLVPRVGAMTLAGIVTYIMGAILFGSFGLTDILFIGSAIAFREVLLYAFGVTSLRRTPARPPNVAAMMVALGLAEAAAMFTSLALQGVFYRMFFANWYIILQVGVTGLAYTALGVYMGRSLGRSLRRVHL